MYLNRDLAEKTLETGSYTFLLSALDHSEYRYSEIVDSFIERVKVQFPEWYEDWDRNSILILDTLQGVIADIIKSVIQSHHPGRNGNLFFHARMVRISVETWLKGTSWSGTDEVIDMFIWYCYYTDRNWFLTFVPYTDHLGFLPWSDAIEKRWNTFETTISRPSPSNSYHSPPNLRNR